MEHLPLGDGQEHVEAASQTLLRRMQAWAATAEDWLWEATPDGDFTVSAAHGGSYCGFTAEEIASLNLVDVLHPDEHERIRGLLQAETGWTSEVFRCRTKDGSDAWFTGHAVADIGPDGVLRRYIGTAQPLRDGAPAAKRARAAAYVTDVLAEASFHIAFQPIVDAETGLLVGAEALSRFPDVGLPPNEVFADAAATGLGARLELMAVDKALTAARSLPDHLYVSVNVSPATIAELALPALIDASGFSPRRLVLEITEHVSVDDYERLISAMSSLKRRGVRFAVDDAGAGFASFTHILALRPELIKLDRTLVTGIDEDAGRRALVSAFVLFSLEIGSTVVAEGIETADELVAAQLVGVDSVQGYLLGRPTTDWRSWGETDGPFFDTSTLNRRA